ncbi:MAG TPA: glycosyl hydrolase 115 family protein, partial [Chitinophagaceae bacterium]|nr:glycosyl hydrolase 115 family protein [Chitinophagaceae bacterium]
MKKCLGYILFLLLFPIVAIHAQNMVMTTGSSEDFPIVSNQRTATICVDSKDYFLVRKAAEWLQQDIQRVTGTKPEMAHQMKGVDAIIIGSIQKSDLIKKWAAQHKIDTLGLSGKWEAYKIQVVAHPKEGIEKALVIVGSDRRGTAYGVLTLSKKMGISPWYWWADVPVKKEKSVFVKKGTYHFHSPAVKYRGFFINDEAPALSGWAREKFGGSTRSPTSMDSSITSKNGFNHYFYKHVFELLLRLKANFLWPAMWGKAFAVDDRLNPVLADKYGIVMGTAHNEPMMRARNEWDRFGKGAWNYQKNAVILDSFWRKGIQRMDNRES